MLGTPAPTYQQTVGQKGAGKWGLVIKDASSRRWSRQTQGSLCGVLSIQPCLPRCLTSRLDHCSHHLLALSLLSPEPLQSTLLAAARAMLPNRKSAHVTPHSPAPPASHHMQEGSQTLSSAGTWIAQWEAGKDGSLAPQQAHHPPFPLPPRLQPHRLSTVS